LPEILYVYKAAINTGKMKKIYSIGVLICLLLFTGAKSDDNREITLNLKKRDKHGKPYFTRQSISAEKVAIVVMDAWDYHWCRSWRTRAASLIPRMNYSLERARQIGITIIFSPTNATRDMHYTIQRKATLEIPFHQMPESLDIIADGTSPFLPGNCECGYGHECFYTHNVNNQHPDLIMGDDDYIGVELQEVYNILAKKKITHVILAGFATNICVWGKPAGLKNMINAGFQCTIASDLTEAITQYAEGIFNPTEGTLQSLALIEQEFASSIVLEELLRDEGVWKESPVLDYAHIIPWNRFFGDVSTPKKILVEINCRFHPDAEFRYTLDGTDPTYSSRLYTGPVKISESSQLKTAGFIGRKQVTRISTADYWKLPEIPELPDVYLSDLEPNAEVTGKVEKGSYAVEKPAAFDRSVAGNALANRGLKFPKGIGVQSRSELSFSIKPGYKKFVTMVAVDDECTRWDNPGGLQRWPQWEKSIDEPTSYRISKIIFEVYIDGKLVDQTPVMNNGDMPWGIDVEIPEGSAEITLVARDDEHMLADNHGHADWLNAGFITEESPR
jgi:nicotinamidase-related amidase